MDEPNPSSRPRVLRWIEWGAVVLLVGGVSAYLLWKPLDPMADPRAAHALALVQIHPARSAPSIRQALDAVLQENRKPGRSPSVGDWTVRRDKQATEGDGYLVRVVVRLPGDQAHRWVEWEYLWRVRLSMREVVPLSRPAADIMP